METKQKIRMTVDCAMTVLSIVLMGGTLLFPDDRVHQILGMVLLALWACHVVLNHRWYASLFKGKYPPYRIMQIVVNCGISVCALLLMISGLMMAWFVPFSMGGGLDFARTTHLVGSHWYYLFMCAHLGMHMGVIFGRMGMKDGGQTALSTRAEKRKILIKRILLAVICGYGVYAFVVRGIAKYLFLRQQFFFLNLERGYVLFAVDYLAILVLFAALFHYVGKALLAAGKKKQDNQKEP